MSNIFRFLLTGKDNQTWDIARVGMLASLLMFFGLSIYDIIISKQFNCLSWSASVSTLLAGGSGGIKIKASTEPEPQS